MHAYWDQGLILALWIFGLIAVLSVILGVSGLVSAIRHNGEGWGAPAMIASLGLIAVSALAMVLAWFPFGAQYNRYVPVSGRVTNISSRFISDGSNSVNQRFVVTFANGLQRSCDDSRCALVKPGGTLTVTCERDFQFNAPAEGWNCNFVSYKPPTTARTTALVRDACAVLHVANGRDSLDRWSRVHHHSVSEIITASLNCHFGVWPKRLAEYFDAGFLHRPMPKGLRFYTVNGF